MIIRATLNNKEHTGLLEKFFSAFFTNMQNYLYTEPMNSINGLSKETMDEVIKITENNRKFMYLANTDDTPGTVLKAEEKEFVLNAIKGALIKFLKGDSYLVDHLLVELVNYYEDEWENGEALYYFTVIQQFIIN